MPRSPASTAASLVWSQFSRDLSQTDAAERQAALVAAEGQPWTWKDLLTRSAYGNLITWEGPPTPPPPPEEEGMLAIRLQSSDTSSIESVPVNNMSYIRRNAFIHLIDFSVVAYTHFRITGFAGSTRAGQTVTMQLATYADFTVPLSVLGDDLVLTFAAKNVDSGWLALAAPPVVDSLLILAAKGSDSAVDIATVWLEVQYKKV